MPISAQVQNSQGSHRVTLRTNDHEHGLAIAAGASGFGSSANGGELLCLALATCYCNDIYREAKGRGITVAAVEVEVRAEFGGVGEPARSLGYRARVTAHASQDAIRELMRHTDTVVEIQNTLRLGLPVALEELDAVALP